MDDTPTRLREHIQARDGGSFDAYLARPARPNGRVVVVLQEIFGVTRSIRGVADRYADAGYLALAPDLFWRITPGMELSHSKEDMARAFDALGKFDDALALQDIAATVDHGCALLGDAQAPVAVVGLCLGGKLAYRAAANLRIGAAVGFYGVGIEKHLDEARKLGCPLMLHFGERDQYVTPEARSEIRHAVDAETRARIHVYPEGDHGFYTRGDPALVAQAHQRTLAFLDEQLGHGAQRGRT